MTASLVRAGLAALWLGAFAVVANAQELDDPVTRAMRHAEASVEAAEVAPVRLVPVAEPMEPVEVAGADSLYSTSSDGAASASTGNSELDRVVAEAAAQHGVDRRLVVALMRQESGFRRTAVSPKGAAGYMQLMPATARRFGVTDVFDARQNIHAGVRYLRLLLDLFDGDRELALAAYNAGEGRVGSIMGRTGVRQFEAMARRGLLPAETRAYVPAILTRWTRLGGVTPAPPVQGPTTRESAPPGRRVDAPTTLSETLPQ